MFVYLAHSGGRIELPTATQMVESPGTPEVQFLDANRAVVAVFRREDIMLYTDEDLDTGQDEMAEAS
jgi:hypothetical protein